MQYHFYIELKWGNGMRNWLFWFVKLRCWVKKEHLAIPAATNDNIWIWRAELKGKNVVWALQEQLYIKTHKNEHTHISKQRFPCIRSFTMQQCIYSSLSLIKPYAYTDIRGKRQYAVHFLALFPFVENFIYLCYLYVLSKCHWSQRLKPNHDTFTTEGTRGTHITFEWFSSLVILIECLAQINRSFQI